MRDRELDILSIDATENTPRVFFNHINRIFLIEGESRPENVKSFYQPVLDWMNDLIKTFEHPDHASSFVFNFKLDYFNSASHMFITKIVLLINELYKTRGNVRVRWHYAAIDEDMYEAGAALKESVDVPFELCEKNAFNNASGF